MSAKRARRSRPPPRTARSTDLRRRGEPHRAAQNDLSAAPLLNSRRAAITVHMGGYASMARLRSPLVAS